MSLQELNPTFQRPFSGHYYHLQIKGDDREDGPPVRSLAEAYAELLGLEPHEAEGLVDIEPQALDGSSGEMVYSLLLDFEGHASPEIAAKILDRHGSLQIEVWPGFFENVRDDDWPN